MSEMERKRESKAVIRFGSPNRSIDDACTVEELTAQLTVEEMAQMCVGTLRAEEGRIVGNASNGVPGAAGDTSAVLLDSRGIKKLVLADGPAGLRLQPHFKTMKSGGILQGGMLVGDSFEPFDTDLCESEVDDYSAAFVRR